MPPSKRRWTAFAVAMAVLIATPLAVVASDAFTDVPDSNVFHDDIAWLADAGVTKGCNPPDNTNFCPSDEVTREQMAAFMRRLAENKVVDAATAVEAENAGTLDGLNATDLVPVLTPLHYLGSDIDNSVTGDYELLRDVGTFTKAGADSLVLLTWNGHARVNGDFCEYQLRVDGKKDTGSDSADFEGAASGSAVVYGADSPIHVTALFPGLSAGDHAVSIWLRGDATDCSLNFGNFGQTILVEEFNGSIGTASLLSQPDGTSPQGGEG